jgi:carboxymethylenebutenolidase
MNKIIWVIVAIVVIVGGYFMLSDRASAPTDVAEDDDIITETVTYHGDVEGFLARPEDDDDDVEQRPALILIHEWWGLNDDIKSIAENFAKEGYVALAVDMYNGEVTIDSAVARTLSSGVRDDVEGAFENLEAALAYLRSRNDVDRNSLASVGWCFGGGWAYQMALNGLDINGSVMYYGQFNPDDDFSMMKSDILGHFGEEDASIAVDGVREFQAALATANGNHEVYIYPNVGHGFANLRGGDNLAYRGEEAELAWERTQEFLSNLFTN